MRQSAVALLVLLGACQAPAPAPGDRGAAEGRPPEGPSTAAPSAAAPVVAHQGPWSREALAPSGDRSPQQGPPVLGPVDPQAFEELVAATPEAQLPSTGEDGGTRIGTDTGLPADRERAPAVDPADPSRTRVVLGDVKMVGRASSPAIEKAARAQLYWPLVQRCRGPGGAILPPDTVLLSFNIDADGYLIPSSILATALDPRFEEAAACMRRELSGLSFRTPAGARGQPTPVEATVPSVD